MMETTQAFSLGDRVRVIGVEAFCDDTGIVRNLHDQFPGIPDGIGVEIDGLPGYGTFVFLPENLAILEKAVQPFRSRDNFGGGEFSGGRHSTVSRAVR